MGPVCRLIAIACGFCLAACADVPEGVGEAAATTATVESSPAAAPRAELVAHFRVLRRQRTAKDRGPGDVAMPPGSDANPALSRAVGSSPHMRAWLVPGEAQLCVVERLRGTSAGAVSCHDA